MWLCLSGSSPAKLRDAVTQSGCGQHWAPVTDRPRCFCWNSTPFTLAHLNMSQIASSSQPRICLRTRCPCHSTPPHFYLFVQYVIWTSEVSMSHMQQVLKPMGTFPRTEKVALNASVIPKLVSFPTILTCKSLMTQAQWDSKLIKSTWKELERMWFSSLHSFDPWAPRSFVCYGEGLLGARGAAGS